MKDRTFYNSSAMKDRTFYNSIMSLVGKSSEIQKYSFNTMIGTSARKNYLIALLTSLKHLQYCLKSAVSNSLQWTAFRVFKI